MEKKEPKYFKTTVELAVESLRYDLEALGDDQKQLFQYFRQIEGQILKIEHLLWEMTNKKQDIKSPQVRVAPSHVCEEKLNEGKQVKTKSRNTRKVQRTGDKNRDD